MLSIEREPVVAGTFYSSDPKELINQLKDCFKPCSNVINNNIAAMVVPHAGYIYSGKVAAYAYSIINKDSDYENIFVIGSSHHVSFNGASVYNKGHYKTPLGVVPVNLEVANNLIAESKNVVFNDNAHSEEHTIEVQLPFLQYQLKNLRHIVPIVIGVKSHEACMHIAKALLPYFNKKNLFVFSTDFSHYPSDIDARLVDGETVDAICSNQAENLIKVIAQHEKMGINNLYTSLCGWSSVLTLMYLTEGKDDYKYKKIKYMTSGEVMDKRRVVGYQSLLIERLNKSIISELTQENKKSLLTLAHQAIENHLVFNKESLLTKNKYESIKGFDSAFVSVYVKDTLRGCIGQFDSTMELTKLISEMAITAAYKDNRFEHITGDELDEIRVEISLLTPMKKISNINEIELGKHGVYIKKGEFSGTFLPQVVNKTNWDLEEFLGRLSRDKAHLDWDGWKEADLYIYEAIVFSD